VSKKIDLSSEDRQQILKLSKERNVFLEGNIIKLISDSEDQEFKDYLKEALDKDNEKRRNRLKITRQMQAQNKELLESKEENDNLMVELKGALNQADAAKQAALNDLDLLQKKTQFELIGRIVQISLWIICGVGVLTTVLFLFAMLTGRDTTLLGNTWSNLFGILLTNSFSIIGTIMGVKYASEKDSSTENKK